VNVLDAGIEGVRSITQPCQLVILVPVAAAVVAGRASWRVVVAAVSGIAVGGWLFITRAIVVGDAAIRWSSLIVICAFGVLLWRRARTPGDLRAAPAVEAVLAAAVGLVTTTWWRPCVGEQLGELLTRGPNEPWATLPASVAFMVGMSTPILAIGLIRAAWQPTPRVAMTLGFVAAGAGLLLGLSVVSGQHGEVVATLFEWSQP